MDPNFLVVHPCHQPACNVTTTRDTRYVVECAEHPRLCQRLQDSQVKGGATNSAARESQSQQTGLRRRPSCTWAQSQISGSFYLLGLLLKDVFNRWAVHDHLDTSRRFCQG